MDVKILKSTEIFKPGGIPNYTYIDRQAYESQLIEAKDGLGKLIVVTGMTKSGKTVLVKRVFPKEHVIWIDGGHIGTEDDIWSAINLAQGAYTDFSATETESTVSSTEFTAEGSIGISSTKAGSALKTSDANNEASTTTKLLKATPRATVVESLRKSPRPIIIDDFHYLEKELQAQVIRFLKPFILDGLPVLIIAIPHTRYDTVKVEREMTGRIKNINIPSWQHDELLQIAKVGFPLLNIFIEEEYIDTLSNEALGSPHLMQEFCLGVCRKEKIPHTEDALMEVNPSEYLDELFHKVAEDTSRTMFEKLAKGPRKRTDRLERKLKDGTITDIYGLVLKALSSLQPGTNTVQSDTIRNSIRQILQDETPRTHEISRVIERMADIAALDATSAPIIEWDKSEQELHIIDPFFAYYLKWGIASK